MTYFESLDFVYALIFERFDPPIWIWSILAFLLSLIVIHLLWGRLWNAEWGLFTRPTIDVTSIILALVVGASALTWLAADRSHAWLELQRTVLTQQFAESGPRNRRILKDVRSQIGDGPSENELTLQNSSNLLVLVETAAASVGCPLTESGPLGPGAPCKVGDPNYVAQEIVLAASGTSFPITVTPYNRWAKAAVTSQVERALSHATPLLLAGIAELKTVMAVLFWFALGIQTLLVFIAAVADIRVHPSAESK